MYLLKLSKAYIHFQSRNKIHQDTNRGGQDNSQNHLFAMRHAQSKYNVGCEQHIKERKMMHLTWDEVCLDQLFNKFINFNHNFIDSPITERGVQQCKQAKNQMLNTRIDLVLTSPMRRALMTCQETFIEGRVTDPKVIVVPQLAEVFRYACDLTDQIDEKKQQYKHFDFGAFEGKDELWFFDYQDPKFREICLGQFKGYNKAKYRQLQMQILFHMQKGHIFETDDSLLKKAKCIAQVVNQYRNQGYPNIVVLSHHYVIHCLLHHNIFLSHQAISCIHQIPNATPFEVTLQLP